MTRNKYNFHLYKIILFALTMTVYR